jgi:Asp-tRNA(Asn)/Glu-tRNA(Gln) amidotransferase A subunit family amidase
VATGLRQCAATEDQTWADKQPFGYSSCEPEISTGRVAHGGEAPEVRQAVLSAVDHLAAAGASVVEVSLPHAATARVAQRAIMFSEAYAYHQSDLRSRRRLACH